MTEIFVITLKMTYQQRIIEKSKNNKSNKKQQISHIE